jgi:hypothetical protein
VWEGVRTLQGENRSVLKFKRVANDEVLDRVLRVLQQSGGVIQSVEVERSTLLDVLESYEKETGQ